MMDDLMKRTNCKLPPSVSIGGLRHMLAAVCQMAVEANADRKRLLLRLSCKLLLSKNSQLLASKKIASGKQRFF